MKNKKLIVIMDSIPLPALKWGWDFQGPVTNPTYFSDDIIESLLRGTLPVKFMYAVNPENNTQRFHLSLDKLKLTDAEMFPSLKVETPVVVNTATVSDATEANVNASPTVADKVNASPTVADKVSTADNKTTDKAETVLSSNDNKQSSKSVTDAIIADVKSSKYIQDKPGVVDQTSKDATEANSDINSGKAKFKLSGMK